MTIALVILIFVLLGIAVWQLVSIFELSQKITGREDSPVANDNDNQTQGYLMFGFLAFIYLGTFYSFWKWGKFLLPTASSEHGKDYDNLMLITFILIFIVQFITQALLFYFSYKYRGKKENRALYYADNDKLEFIWTFVPVITLAGLILYGLFAWNDIMNFDENEGDPLIIELYAQQFNWTARYAGKDNVLGEANVRMIDNDRANILGIDEADINGDDDIVVKELHLPVKRKVIFKMRSQDVLHSAYMPHFRAQMNCVPGMITEFSFVPTITTEEMRVSKEIVKKVNRTNKIRAKWKAEGKENSDPWQFDYVLLCNKICGKSHYNMQMKIVVETEEKFNEWISSQKTFEETLIK